MEEIVRGGCELDTPWVLEMNYKKYTTCFPVCHFSLLRFLDVLVMWFGLACFDIQSGIFSLPEVNSCRSRMCCDLYRFFSVSQRLFFCWNSRCPKWIPKRLSQGIDRLVGQSINQVNYQAFFDNWCCILVTLAAVASPGDSDEGLTSTRDVDDLLLLRRELF